MVNLVFCVVIYAKLLLEDARPLFGEYSQKVILSYRGVARSNQNTVGNENTYEVVEFSCYLALILQTG